jgi:DNA-binding transcriptional LysR family regulator
LTRRRRFERSIELRHLRYFLAVAEELHFGRAAEVLQMSQPPLSQAIRQLEDELGVQLFNRTSRTVALTEAGAALSKQAAAVLASLELAVAETRRADGSSAVLRVGCTPHLPLERLRTFLHALDVSEPSIHPRVTHLGFRDQVSRLTSGELDVGIFDDVGEVAGVEVQALFKGERLGAFLPRAHPLAGRPSIEPEGLRADALVMYPREENPALYDRLLEIVGGAGYGFAGVHEASSSSARDLMLAVADGLGVAVGPVSLASSEAVGTLVSCRPLARRASMPDTVIGWREHPPSQLAAVLVNVRAIARQVRGSAVTRSTSRRFRPTRSRTS